MKFFKKPAVAVILVIILVIASTLLSFEIRFGSKCQQISDGFFDGVYVDGELRPSCASIVKKITGYAEEIRAIAFENGLDTESLDSDLESLKYSIKYSDPDASYVYFCYNDVLNSLGNLKSSLKTANISAEDSESISQLYLQINSAAREFDTTGYNESVRAFLRDYDRFPVSKFYWYTNVIMPSCFE